MFRCEQSNLGAGIFVGLQHGESNPTTAVVLQGGDSGLGL